MREIEFRGKSKFKNTWVYGKLLNHKRIITQSDDETEEMPCFDMCDYQEEVCENTIGQYTGLKDKNSKKIFEGDIVIFNHNRKLPNYISVPEVVKYHQGDCAFQGYPYGIQITTGGAGKLLQPDMMSECEVIGNIYDNPELVGEEV